MAKSKASSIVFAVNDEFVRATVKGEVVADHFATAGEMCLKEAIRHFQICGCAGCVAAEPYFVAALTELSAAADTAAVAGVAALGPGGGNG